MSKSCISLYRRWLLSCCWGQGGTLMLGAMSACYCVLHLTCEDKVCRWSARSARGFTPDAADPALRLDSEAALQQELAWAAHLSLQVAPGNCVHGSCMHACNLCSPDVCSRALMIDCHNGNLSNGSVCLQNDIC